MLTTYSNNKLNAEQWYFLDAVKRAKIILIYKKEFSASVLLQADFLSAIISKMFERTIYKQLYQYFNNKGLMAEQQYGFRSQLSTKYATIKLIDSDSDSRFRLFIQHKHV